MSGAYSLGRLRRALLHFAGGRAVQAVARAVLVLLIVRLLPAGDYGAYMLIVGVSEMLPQLCSFGLLPVGQRYLPELVQSAATRDSYRFVCGITVLQVAVIALACAGLWFFWGRVLPYAGFGPEQIQTARPAIILFVLVPTFRFVVELLQALLEQGKAQTAAALVPLGRMTAVVGLLGVGVEVTLHRLLLLDAAVVAGCLTLAWVLMVHSLRKLQEPEQPRPLPLRKMVRHGWHMAAAQLMSAAYSPGALRLVIANAIGIVESGLFAFLQSLQRMVGKYLPGELLRGLVRPMLISRTGPVDGMDRMERGVRLLQKANLMLVAMGTVAVYVAGDAIVATASGGRFTHAGGSLLLMFLVLGFASQRMVLDMVLQILDLTRTLRRVLLLLPLSLLAAWWCAHYGLNAAIAAIAFGIALVNGICAWRLKVHTGRFRTDWRATGGILLASAVAALSGRALGTLLGPWLALAVAAGLLAVLLAAAKPLASAELDMVARIMGHVAGRVLQPFARKVAA